MRKRNTYKTEPHLRLYQYLLKTGENFYLGYPVKMDYDHCEAEILGLNGSDKDFIKKIHMMRNVPIEDVPVKKVGQQILIEVDFKPKEKEPTKEEPVKSYVIEEEFEQVRLF